MEIFYEKIEYGIWKMEKEHAPETIKTHNNDFSFVTQTHLVYVRIRHFCIMV